MAWRHALRWPLALCGLPVLAACAGRPPSAVGWKLVRPGSGAPLHVSSQITYANQRLPPIMVDGVRVPLPIALQMIKKALGRPWSRAPDDGNLLVCRRETSSAVLLSQHLRTLGCQTNAEYFGEHVAASHERYKCYGLCFLLQRDVVVAVVRYVDGDPRRALGLAALLPRVPPTDSSYALDLLERVPLRFLMPGKAVDLDYPLRVDFIVSHGTLVNVLLKDGRNSSPTPPRILAKNFDRRELSTPAPKSHVPARMKICSESNPAAC